MLHLLLNVLLGMATFVGAVAQETVFVPPDFGVWGQFGYSVELSENGTLAVIGAPGLWGNSGAVYLFQRLNDGSWVNFQRLRPTGSGETFGISVSLSADASEIVIGAYTKTVDGLRQAGTAYIFSFNGVRYEQSQELRVATPAVDSFCGYRVAVNQDGNSALVSCFKKEAHTLSQAGTVSYFEQTPSGNWSELQTLTAGVDQAETDALFGSAVVLKGDQLLIGSQQKEQRSGAVYYFKHTGGEFQRQQVLGSGNSTKADANFGSAIAWQGNHVVIGEHTRDSGGIALAGAAYHFVFNNQSGAWSFEQLLRPSGLLPGSRFGSAVAMSDGGNRLLIGAYMHDTHGYVKAGAVFFYSLENQAYSLRDMFYSKRHIHADARFGNAVDVSGDGELCIIGLRYNDTNQVDNSGAAIALVFDDVHSSRSFSAMQDTTTNFLFSNTPGLSNDPVSMKFTSTAISRDVEPALDSGDTSIPGVVVSVVLSILLLFTLTVSIIYWRHRKQGVLVPPSSVSQPEEASRHRSLSRSMQRRRDQSARRHSRPPSTHLSRSRSNSSNTGSTHRRPGHTSVPPPPIYELIHEPLGGQAAGQHYSNVPLRPIYTPAPVPTSAPAPLSNNPAGYGRSPGDAGVYYRDLEISWKCPVCGNINLPQCEVCINCDRDR